ncbi:hypothetical protein SNE40_012857 [Patella caerulea]|uniref:Carbohydrate sulfotransferase n=1 Tax=Patella caerulea TaxID=87958 RepID=A0AAN8JI82_PATCE
MFVRDPYSRLWSAYLDKFFLPDFWRTYAKNIVLRRHERSLKADICHHDVTFEEFLTYVVDLKDEPGVLNEHWRPIQHICNPCEFRPHLLGKQESFAQDAKYVLHYFNLDYLLPSYDHNVHVEEELRMLIKYNYRLLKQKHYDGCITKQELAGKLWSVFEFNGYLPLGSKTILDATSNYTMNSFTDLVLKTHRNSPKTQAEWRRQRTEAMTAAYKSISNDVIEGLQETFKMDFIHFNYDPIPPGKRV